MRHAGEVALDRLEPLLDAIRHACPELRERKRGAFYRGGVGWLHFHEDPAGMFADLKLDGDWIRFAVNSQRDRTALLRRLKSSLA